MRCHFGVDAQSGGLLLVRFAQRGELIESAGAFTRSSSRREREQLIGRPAHRRYDNNWVAIDPRADNFRDALHGWPGFDGRAAELHHNHASRPSAWSSSAFSTATPAAPRTVLCPNATNL